MTTEKMCPVYIQATATFLLRSSFVINSLSAVVKPAPVNNEATWNLILLVASPVNLKATENASMVNMYIETTAKINEIANQTFILSYTLIYFTVFSLNNEEKSFGIGALNFISLPENG